MSGAAFLLPCGAAGLVLIAEPPQV